MNIGFNQNRKKFDIEFNEDTIHSGYQLPNSISASDVEFAHAFYSGDIDAKFMGFGSEGLFHVFAFTYDYHCRSILIL